MRVHLRNVVHAALERGMVAGYQRVNKLGKPQQKDLGIVIPMMMECVWASLDGLVDFRDDDDPDASQEHPPHKKKIGFDPQYTDVVAKPCISSHDDEETLDDDDVIPLDLVS